MLISDPCLVEWSRHLLKVMKHHFMETLTSKASHTLPPSLADHLDAECQAKSNATKEDACADAKWLYKAELLRQQTIALSDASADFSAWMTSTLSPECQAKELASCAHAECEFACFQMDLETEFTTKCQAVLVAANDDLAVFQLVHAQVPEPHPTGDDLTLDKCTRRAKHCVDPISRPSCSVSCARSPSPSPSQKLDKMPTKADFQVVSQTVPPRAPISDHAQGWARPSIAQEVSGSDVPVTIVVLLVGPNNAKALVGTLGDAISGLPLTPTSCPPGALPTAALLETPLSNPLPDVVMALAAPLGEARPSPAAPGQVYRTRVMMTQSASSPVVPLVERYLSATLSPIPPPTAKTAEDRMMRLLSSTITAALVPLKLSIEDISSCLHTVEETQNWFPGDKLEGLNDPSVGYCIPTIKSENGDEERMDYHIVSALSRAEEEDAEMEEAHTTSAEQEQGTHPYFESIILCARKDTCDQYVEGQLQDLASQAEDDWEDFCHCHSVFRHVLPPADVVNKTFLKLIHIWLSQAQVFDDFAHASRIDQGSTVSTAPEISHFMGTWWGEAHLLRKDSGHRFRSVTASEQPHLPPPIMRTSELTPILSDGSKISGFTDSSPPAPPCYHGTGGVLDLDTPPPGDGHGWSMMGGQKGRSFASIAAAAVKPVSPVAGASVALPPSAAQAAHGFLTKLQLDSLTYAQVINAYNAHFSLKLGLKVSKDNAIVAFLDKSS